MKTVIAFFLLTAACYAQAPAPGKVCPMCGKMDSGCSQSYNLYPSSRLELMYQRRSAEVTSRVKGRQSIPVKVYSDEERAKSKLHCAEMLANNGNIDAGVRWRQSLIKEFPETTTAKMVQEWLWGHGYD